MYLQDGYRPITAAQLCCALGALNAGTITFRAFRTYIGCFELLAIREAAERSQVKPKKAQRRRFNQSELAELIERGGDSPISRELISLRKVGLLSFSESEITVTADTSDHGSELLSLLGGRGAGRLVPVPRQILKFLARCSRPALAKTVVAYLLRGLALDRSGEIRSAGTVKVSWICKLCRISERAARAARAELIRLGWITKDTGSFQRKLNRDGAYFIINTTWRRVLKRFAPPEPEKRTGSAPPIEKLETPNGSKNQKPAHTAARSGFCNSKGEEEAARSKVSRTNSVKKPALKDIQIEDLRRVSTLKVLYAQAVSAKWLPDSESNFQNFVAAAVRAKRVHGDPVRLFVSIVRRQLWHHITQEQEDRAREAIRREHREMNSKGTRVVRTSGAQHGLTSSPGLDNLAIIVQSIFTNLGIKQ